MRAFPFLALFLLVSCAMPAGSATGEAYAPSPDPEAGSDGFAMRSALLADSAERSDDLTAPVVAEAAAPDAPASARQVIYSAALRLVVVSAREAHLSIVAIAKDAGGWLQESDASSVTVRVPAAQFEPVLARIQALGEVADANVRASDVTEEMLDLGIRLENARKARERLLEHLAHSDKIEDTLKIEAELTRVTGEIERMEGRLRYLQSQIAMSTIRVELNTNQPQRAGDELDVPFRWVARLGDGLVAGTVQSRPKQPGWFSRGPGFDPPPGFVRYYRASELVEAMNAEGVRIKVQEHDNFDDGTVGFWSELARSALVQRRSLAVGEQRALDDERALLVGTREVGGETLGYLLLIARSKSDVTTFEAWGPKEAFDRLRPALEASARTLDP